MHEVFLDTSYAIALSSEKDRFHNKALELADQIEADKSVLITTRPVLLETGNALSGLRFRKSAVLLLDSLENDPNVGIVSLTDALYQQSVQFFRKRMDKEWGLVDCISFVVMLERNIFVALTTDDHLHRTYPRGNPAMSDPRILFLGRPHYRNSPFRRFGPSLHGRPPARPSHRWHEGRQPLCAAIDITG